MVDNQFELASIPETAELRMLIFDSLCVRVSRFLGSQNLRQPVVG
jgi:hypothetical protein